MTLYQLKQFHKKWLKLNNAYNKLYPKHHLQFPDSVIKDMLVSLYDSSLKKNKGKSPTYDFCGNIEAKSATLNCGVTPFSKSQNACSRIIYVEVFNTGITVYELSKEDVNSVNKIVQTSQKTDKVSISLSKYKPNATSKKII